MQGKSKLSKDEYIKRLEKKIDYLSKKEEYYIKELERVYNLYENILTINNKSIEWNIEYEKGTKEYLKKGGN